LHYFFKPALLRSVYSNGRLAYTDEFSVGLDAQRMKEPLQAVEKQQVIEKNAAIIEMQSPFQSLY
jgi:hypothetical protein